MTDIWEEILSDVKRSVYDTEFEPYNKTPLGLCDVFRALFNDTRTYWLEYQDAMEERNEELLIGDI